MIFSGPAFSNVFTESLAMPLAEVTPSTSASSIATGTPCAEVPSGFRTSTFQETIRKGQSYLTEKDIVIDSRGKEKKEDV